MPGLPSACRTCTMLARSTLDVQCLLNVKPHLAPWWTCWATHSWQLMHSTTKAGQKGGNACKGSGKSVEYGAAVALRDSTTQPSGMLFLHRPGWALLPAPFPALAIVHPII